MSQLQHSLLLTWALVTILLLPQTSYSQEKPPAIEWQKSLGGSGHDAAYDIAQTSDGGYIVAGSSESTDGDVTGNHGNYDYWIVKLTSVRNIQWQKSLGGSGWDRATSIAQTSDGGYIVAGWSQSTDGDVTGNHGDFDCWIVKLTSVGDIQWQKSLGGSGDDAAYDIAQTSDGGYIVAGKSSSTDGDVTGNHGSNDYWIVKLTSVGDIQWQKSLGGSGDDAAYDIAQTSDGGCIVAGSSSSDDGDVTGHHGSSDYSDYWVVKLTNTGQIEWQKSLGGNKNDYSTSIQHTSDGGYIVAGSSESNDGDVTGHHGSLTSSNFWVVKLASTGEIQWQKSLGGNGSDVAESIVQTSDGGYIVAGVSSFADGDVTSNHGREDYWIVKLTIMGIIEWQRSLGGSRLDEATSIVQTSDGGSIVAGTSGSNNGDVTGNHGLLDSWIVKLTSTGLIEWQQSLGGSRDDYAYSIEQTSDSGYIVAGSSTSADGDVTSHHGSSDYSDYWVVKLTSTGQIEWQKSLGGSHNDVAKSIEQTSDGGYIVAGYSLSTDGDVTGHHRSLDDIPDFWVVKLASTGEIQWQKSLGGSGSDVAESIEQTSDGGYIVAGYSLSTDGDVTSNHGSLDYWIVKLTSTGGIEWQKSLGGSDSDYSTSIQHTSDGGYIVAGGSLSNDGDVTGHHGSLVSDDYWVVKLTSTGVIEWQRSLGGSRYEFARSIIQTSDGGYIVAGESESTDGDVTGHHGSLGVSDYWIVKLTSTGVIEWQKSLGGSGDDFGFIGIEQTADSGYIVAGSSLSTDGDVTGHHGSIDYWIVKLASTGQIQWQRSLGGSHNDVAKSIEQTSDGGYIIAGYSLSTDGDVTGNHGITDYWIVKFIPTNPINGKFTSLILQGVDLDGKIGANYPTAFAWSTDKVIPGTKTIELSEDNGQTWKPTPAATATGNVTTVNYTTPDYAIPQALFRIYSATDKSDMYTMTTPIAISKTATSVNNMGGSPITLTMSENYPNPFSATTRINFELPERSFVRLSVDNEQGVEVACLVNANLEAGGYSVTFSAQNLANGIYIYRLESGGKTVVRKMSVVK